MVVKKNTLVGVCVLAATNVCAQQNRAELDTIVVTASRTPVRLNDSGSSVSILTREDIERRQIVSIADILRDVPGIAVSQSGNLGAQTQLRVRGSEANHVLVMIDGIEANDPTVGDEFQFEHLTTSDIERIEVVRGPQSALWGSDAIGGVINVITRGAEAASGPSGFLEAGSFGTARAGGSLGTAGDRYQLRLDLGLLDADGPNISRSGSEEDGYRNGSANLKARVEISGRTSLDFSIRHTQAAKQFDATDFVLTGLPVDSDLASDSAQSYVSAKASLWAGGMSVHSLRLTYLDTGTDNFTDGAQVSAVAVDKLGLYYQGSLELGARVAGTLAFALDHEQESFRQRGAASGIGDPNQDQSLDATGYVLEYRFSPAERLNLSVSARYDASSDFDSVTTHRVTGVYALPDDKTRLRASYGTGQKSPTFVERFGFFPDSFLGNPDLRPEQSEGWEIGINRLFVDGRVSVDATYFSEELADEINGFAFDPVSFQFTAANETGLSERRGLELAASAKPSDLLSLTASYTYLDSTQPDTAGRQIDEIRRPNHMAAVNLNYSPSMRLNVNLNISYNGAQYDTFFPPFPEPSERLELSSYTLVTVAGSLSLTDRLELYGRIENLLDETYEDVVGFAMPGIAAYVGLRTRR
jgi:vitamin B12 transporter